MLPLCRQGTVPLLARELPLCWYPLCYPWKRRLKDGYCFTFTSTVFVWSWNIWIWVTKLCFFFLIVTDPDLLFLKTIEKSITLWQAMKRFNCPPFVAIEKKVIMSNGLLLRLALKRYLSFKLKFYTMASWTIV